MLLTHLLTNLSKILDFISRKRQTNLKRHA